MAQNKINKILRKSFVNILPDSPLFQLCKGTPLSTIKLQLTNSEIRIIEYIKITIEQNMLHSTARVAGGWVRDKILGNQSKDMDITLDNISGYDFALKLRDVILKSEKSKSFKIAEIKENPEKSKNLATATFHVFDISIDINNLRTEHYDLTSRIPKAKFGNAYKDAERRDFTLNTLFFNINKNCLEDLTGRGIKDMIDWKLTTPLEPRQTLLDDPLRCIRACRFASRFGFSVDQNIINFMKTEEIQKALIEKVSKERIGQELINIFEKSIDPSMAINLFGEMKIFNIIFKIPDFCVLAKNSYWSSLSLKHEITLKKIENFGSFSTLHHFSFFILAIKSTQKINEMTEKEKIIDFFTVILIGLAPFVFGNKKTPVVFYVLKHSLMQNNNIIDEVTKKLENFLSLGDILNDYSKNGKFDLYAVGNLICLLQGKYLPLFSIARILIYSANYDQNSNLNDLKEYLNKKTEKIDQNCKNLDDLENFISENQIFDCYNWAKKPFFNGREIQKIKKLKSGPKIGKILKMQLNWRLENPKSKKDDCEKWLKSFKV